MYVQKENYSDAAEAYLCQLKRLSGRPEHFRGFARFYRNLSSNISADCLIEYQNKIIDAIKKGEIAQDIQRQLIENFGETFITDEEISKVLAESDDDKNLDSLKVFLNSAHNDEVKIVLLYQINSSKEFRNIKTKTHLVFVGEKRELYPDTLHLVGKILQQQQKPNPIVIRTLLRISRKLGDYSYAESILNFNDLLIQNSDFNIQYELVYYFDNAQNKILLDKTLRKMHDSAEKSIPIARTLYNFYLNFNRFDDAQAIYEHIQKLQPSRKQSQESDQVIWQKLKDLVSEQEHNRQMIALRDLLKGFSHELGQPITNIRYKVQLQQLKIQRGVSTSEEIDKLLITILEQTARIGILLDRFRPIVSSQSTATHFSIKDCIVQVFEDLADRLKGNRITYQIDAPSNIYIFGDQIQFSQVFYNLILNSMQAIEDSGAIQVQVRLKKDKVTIFFSDNGPGIPDTYAKKYLNLFFHERPNCW